MQIWLKSRGGCEDCEGCVSEMLGGKAEDLEQWTLTAVHHAASAVGMEGAWPKGLAECLVLLLVSPNRMLQPAVFRECASPRYQIEETVHSGLRGVPFWNVILLKNEFTVVIGH